MKKKKDALQQANSLIKKTENAHTPSSIKKRLKIKKGVKK